MHKGEEAFSAALAIVLVIMVVVWGGTAMLLGLTAGSTAYVLIFRKHLRDRGWLGAMIGFVAAAFVAAAVVIVVSLRQGHW